MQHFRTPDLATVAVLLYKDCRLVTLDRTDKQRAVFVFEESPELQKILQAYWSGELVCPAQSLLASLKRAKHILYDFTA